MSQLQSPVKKINDIQIEPLDGGKVVSVTKAIKVEGITFILGTNGKLYCNQVMKHGYFLFGTYRWSGPMVRALHRMGYLTKAEMEKHLTTAEKLDKARELNDNLTSLHKLTDKLGIKLTAVQKRQVKKLTTACTV